MSAQLAAQKALRARLVASPGVTALVPAEAIIDRNKRPAPVPSIIIGEAQEIDEGATIARRRVRVVHTAHVWTRETGLVEVNAIMGAMRAALAERLVLDAGFHCADSHVASARAMRDPDGETGHGVVTIEVMVQEVAS